MVVFLRRLPVSAGCAGLGFVGLASLTKPLGTAFPYLFGCPAALILSLVFLKLCLPGQLRAVCGDFTSLSLLAGTAMGFTLLSAQMKTLLGLGWAVFLWAGALLVHIAVFIGFSLKLVTEKPGSRAVRGSWLLVYAGLAAGAISAPAFGAQAVGRLLLVPAGFGALLLLPAVYRADRCPGNIPAPQRPLFCITAAPVSIWLAGWLSVSPAPSPLLTAALVLLAQVLYLPALLRCLNTVRGMFSPAFAAFTFPFVISASALSLALRALGLGGIWRVLLWAESLLAVFLCCFVLFCFVKELLPKKPE